MEQNRGVDWLGIPCTAEKPCRKIFCSACKADWLAEQDKEVLSEGHYPQTHSSPDRGNWCCMACCHAGQPLPGHFGCHPTQSCGQGCAGILATARAFYDVRAVTRHKWVGVVLFPDGEEHEISGTFVDKTAALDAAQDTANHFNTYGWV